jgi:hypothetical protein
MDEPLEQDLMVAVRVPGLLPGERRDPVGLLQVVNQNGVGPSHYDLPSRCGKKGLAVSKSPEKRDL